MALTVGELVAKLNRLDPNAYPIAYHSSSDMEFSVDGVEVDDQGDVILDIEDH